MQYYEQENIVLDDDGINRLNDILMSEIHRLESNRHEIVDIIADIRDDLHLRDGEKFDYWIAYRNSGVDTLFSFSKDYHYTMVFKVSFNLADEEVKFAVVERMKSLDMLKAFCETKGNKP